MKRKKLDMVNEDEKEILRFIVIVVVILLVVGIIYLISYFKERQNEYHYDDVKSGVVDSGIVTIGTMLNKAEDEYYVAIYKDDDTKATYYNNIISSYASKEKALNVYYCNLNNKLNEDYIAKDGKSNPKAKKMEDLQLGDFTLLKIKEGKITKYIEDTTKFEEELQIEEKD